MNAVELNEVEISYGKKIIHKNLNIQFRLGEISVITGESGSGKTTILNAIGMLHKHTKGSIKIFNEENVIFDSKIGKEILKNKIGFIFQNFVLLEDKTVNQNLSLYSDENGIMSIMEALEFVNMEWAIDKYIYELSGGEQQRICIARILVKNFEIILGDEITGSLDKKNKMLIMDLMNKIKEMNKAIILVTHDEVVLEYADKIYDIQLNNNRG